MTRCHQYLPTDHKKWLPIVLENLHAGTEVRYTTVIGAHRLKCIPLQNAGHCVIGTYVRRPHSLSAAFCPTCHRAPSTAGRASLAALESRSRHIRHLTQSNFLANSKSLLDLDHCGFGKVKRRLMGYLTVVRPCALSHKRQK
ncbi:hypothetical protein EDB86DRAFT_1912918 [Lactarius hatsudake]|nr:hypothetical protein EDB86DRAFT_1912918 [Lactarius hatsudake]